MNYIKVGINIVVFLLLSWNGYKDLKNDGFPEQQTHQTMTELGLKGYKNSGVVWYGTYSYYNDNYVLDLMYKTRPCKEIKNRGDFYPGHNKYDYLKDTGLTYYIGGLWKPNTQELQYLTHNYKPIKYKDVIIYTKK